MLRTTPAQSRNIDSSVSAFPDPWRSSPHSVSNCVYVLKYFRIRCLLTDMVSRNSSAPGARPSLAVHSFTAVIISSLVTVFLQTVFYPIKKATRLGGSDVLRFSWERRRPRLRVFLRFSIINFLAISAILAISLDTLRPGKLSSLKAPPYQTRSSLSGPRQPGNGTRAPSTVGLQAFWNQLFVLLA